VIRGPGQHARPPARPEPPRHPDFVRKDEAYRASRAVRRAALQEFLATRERAASASSSASPAGAGRASGIRAGLGRDPDAALNHWDVAIDAHRAHFPNTEHHLADIYEEDAARGAAGRADRAWLVLARLHRPLQGQGQGAQVRAHPRPRLVDHPLGRSAGPT
jgi:hypothetical protein